MKRSYEGGEILSALFVLKGCSPNILDYALHRHILAGLKYKQVSVEVLNGYLYL